MFRFLFFILLIALIVGFVGYIIAYFTTWRANLKLKELEYLEKWNKIKAEEKAIARMDKRCKKHNKLQNKSVKKHRRG